MAVESAPQLESPGITRGQWMALGAAFLGWLFDGFEMGLFPLVARPALLDLLGGSQETDIGLWIGVMTAGFLVGAATGGVLFGWLGDRIGRVRAMALSVLTYAAFSGLCGVAGSVWQIFLFRFIASLGMGGEWSLGVSLVMELWPNRSRGWLAGLIGAASNVGFITIGVASLALTQILTSLHQGLLDIGLPASTVTTLTANNGWRILMLLGAAPALLTFFIRLFVPESERWLHEHGRGATSHWATHDLIGVLIGACGPLLMVYLWAVPNPLVVRLIGSTAGLALAIAGFTFPVVRYLQRSERHHVPIPTLGSATSSPAWRPILNRMLLGACLSGVALLGTWGSLQWAAPWADSLTGGQIPTAKAWTQIVSGFGAIAGTIGAALIGNWLGRRITYFLLCVAALGSALIFFQGNDSFGPMFLVTVFFAGGLTASFYGWLPLYLPELFPTAVRATGQGFAFNFGRILAAVGTLQTGFLMQKVFNGDYSKACSVMSLIYLVGMAIIWLAPETHGKPLPE